MTSLSSLSPVVPQLSIPLSSSNEEKGESKEPFSASGAATTTKKNKKNNKKSKSSGADPHRAHATRVKVSVATNYEHLCRVLPWIHDTPMSLADIGNRFLREYDEVPREDGLIGRLFECALWCDPPLIRQRHGSHTSDVWQLVPPPVASSSSSSSSSSATIPGKWIKHVAHTIDTTIQSWQPLSQSSLPSSSLASIDAAVRMRAPIRRNDNEWKHVKSPASSSSSSQQQQHPQWQWLDDIATPEAPEPQSQPIRLRAVAAPFEATLADRRLLEEVLPLIDGDEPTKGLNLSDICAAYTHRHRASLSDAQVKRLMWLFNWACRNPNLMRDYPRRRSDGVIIMYWKLVPHVGKSMEQVVAKWKDSSHIEDDMKDALDGTTKVRMIDIIMYWQTLMADQVNNPCYPSYLVRDLLTHTRERFNVVLADDIKWYVYCIDRFKLHGHGDTRVITLIDHDPTQTDQHNRNKARQRAKFVSEHYYSTAHNLAATAADRVERVIRADDAHQPRYQDVQRQLRKVMPSAPPLYNVIGHFTNRFTLHSRNTRPSIIRFAPPSSSSSSLSSSSTTHGDEKKESSSQPTVYPTRETAARVAWFIAARINESKRHLITSGGTCDCSHGRGAGGGSVAYDILDAMISDAMPAEPSLDAVLSIYSDWFKVEHCDPVVVVFRTSSVLLSSSSSPSSATLAAAVAAITTTAIAESALVHSSSQPPLPIPLALPPALNNATTYELALFIADRLTEVPPDHAVAYAALDRMCTTTTATTTTVHVGTTQQVLPVADDAPPPLHVVLACYTRWFKTERHGDTLMVVRRNAIPHDAHDASPPPPSPSSSSSSRLAIPAVPAVPTLPPPLPVATAAAPAVSHQHQYRATAAPAPAIGQPPMDDHFDDIPAGYRSDFTSSSGH